MDAKKYDGRANIKPIKIEKRTDKYSRENVQTSTNMEAYQADDTGTENLVFSRKY